MILPLFCVLIYFCAERHVKKGTFLARRFSGKGTRGAWTGNAGACVFCGRREERKRQTNSPLFVFQNKGLFFIFRFNHPASVLSFFLSFVFFRRHFLRSVSAFHHHMGHGIYPDRGRVRFFERPKPFFLLLCLLRAQAVHWFLPSFLDSPQ